METEEERVDTADLRVEDPLVVGLFCEASDLLVTGFFLAETVAARVDAARVEALAFAIAEVFEACDLRVEVALAFFWRLDALAALGDDFFAGILGSFTHFRVTLPYNDPRQLDETGAQYCQI